jgi:hypothetical protein
MDLARSHSVSNVRKTFFKPFGGELDLALLLELRLDE